MARKAYSMCESGPCLYPSPLCPARTGDDNGGHCPLSEIHRCHSLHSTWSICAKHSWPQRSFYGKEAILNSWIILLSLVQRGECVWFLGRREGRRESVIFLFFWWRGRSIERERRRELSSLVRERRGVYAWCLGAGESEQQDSARSNRLPLRIRKRASQGERTTQAGKG